MNMKSNPNIESGNPYPLGATIKENGVNFAVFAKGATSVELWLFEIGSSTPTAKLSLPGHSGNIWHGFVEQLELPVVYGYRVNEKWTLSDPYAREVTTTNQWGNREKPYEPLGLLSRSVTFDWQGIQSPRLNPEDIIIYEMHVRGFTQDGSSRVKHPGTYLGVVEKIPYLLELGVNAVELLPLHEFNENEVKLLNPTTGKPLQNYWGYSTVNFYTPMNRYASKADPGSSVEEFKTMVRELHRHGIEVYLDVVYNHTAEGDTRGPVISYKGLANSVYYMLDKDGNYINVSGCGNTFNANQPVVIEHILNSLRYWVSEMHVDGFRFDLAAALSRGSRGELIPHAPLIGAITEDPILSTVKLFAEPWDAHGHYMVGHFWRESPRWGEWNGRYRDCVRKFIKGTPGIEGDFITRLCGSQDMYHDRSPLNSVNYVTIHDGFTLRDLVSYNEKHNYANSENNLDGTNNNDSWNCGEEGPSKDPEIVKLRERQIRNFYFTVLISKGTPMLLMGDEYGHTKFGNNNTWCHDSRLNWFLWDQLEINRGLYRFCSGLIHFRKKTPLLKQKKFLNPGDAEWHGKLPLTPEWDHPNHFVAFTLLDHSEGNDLYIAFNASNKKVTIKLPNPKEGRQWHWVVNTGNESPEDFLDGENPVEKEDVEMISYSVLMLEQRKA